MSARVVVFYISGHGFGHASRDIEIINALLAADPALRIAVRTTAPRWLFERTVRGRVDYHHAPTDTGVVQIDSLHLDPVATVAQARAFMADFARRVDDEARWIRQVRAALVLADIPPLGMAAAARADVPGVAVGNFTWHWIYSAYDGADDVVRDVAQAYASATLALRLPMHGGFDVFREVVDLPFVSRRSRRDPAETRRLLGLPADERLVLVSFGGFGVDGFDLDALQRLEGYAAVVSGRVPMGTLPDPLRHGRRGSLLPLDEQRMYDAGLRYEDLVRAVDVVVTKPGYGIISECVANDTALLYTSRGRFIEYDVLVAEMPRFVRARFIDHEALFAGRWTPHLDALLAQPAPTERPAVDGAERAAAHLLPFLRIL